MVQLESDIEWLKRGSQRLAVAEVLARPMTSSEILLAARTLSPRIELRDVWFLLRQFEQRGLISRFNGKSTTGKLFHFTTRGRKVAFAAFQKSIPLPPKLDWTAYAQIVGAKTRRLVFMQLAKLAERHVEQITASGVRKNQVGCLPISLSQTIRALRELCHVGLLACNFNHEKHRVYVLTKEGKRILSALNKQERVSEVFVSNPY